MCQITSSHLYTACNVCIIAICYIHDRVTDPRFSERATAFHEGTVKHIFFIAETKGTLESLELRPIEQAKISCAKKLFNEMSTSSVKYHDVDSYQSLLNIMNSL